MRKRTIPQDPGHAWVSCGIVCICAKCDKRRRMKQEDKAKNQLYSLINAPYLC
uniref:Uncharacterized protein n=1 Tax=Faecalibaculum rodentium TaxID=1702221 RepID=A0A140DSM0_9FIRM|nr:hypothetical protein AALO17_05130 [Faecalibaculum rodentium]